MIFNIDCTLTPCHLVFISHSHEPGQNESAPKTNHYSEDIQGFKPWQITRDI